MPRRPTHPAFVRWADVTATCLALRRAALRADHPRASADDIEHRLRTELDRARARRDAAYRRHA